MSTEKKPAVSANAPAPAAQGAQKLLLVGVLVVLLLIGVVIWAIVSGKGNSFGNAADANVANAAEPEAAPKANAPSAAARMPARGELLPSGLRIETIREGRGPNIGLTDNVQLRYELRVLGRSEVIDGGMDRSVTMSPGGTIPGFAEALTRMKAGGEARFWVPPQLGYGDQPREGAPFGPNDILEFHVRVERIVPGAAAPRVEPRAATGNSAAPAAGGR